MRCLKRPNDGYRRLQDSFRFAMTLMATVILAATPAMADIYRFVDKDGVIHYTDDPAKIPPEYESVVEHRSIQRSTVVEETEPPAESGTETPAEAAGSAEPERFETPGAPPGGDEGGAGAQEAGEPEGSEETGGQEGEAEPPAGEVEAFPGAEEQPPVTTETSPAPAQQSDTAPEGMAQLQQERQALLQRQAELQNDESYQSRKTKRKYQNRPYIQEMMAEEVRIGERLRQIEKLLQ